ncbi:CHC2 zinc finger domain-containing protein [Parapedobacter deserti]|uniref:CHC2 zinc finger domain-containing protein n=1 Tax=Parapedobacter deserti TaxID=1912957 RepID=A0ABV7JJ77_9SPHI
MTIPDIKAQLSIVTVLEHYGIRMNRNRMVCCPFHDDKNPSMQVYPDTNTVFCFSGNCSKNGKAMDCLASCHTLKIQTKPLIYNKVKTKTSNRI